jgi:hypothetical protein
METLAIIYEAIDELNLDLDASNKIIKSVDTEIFGPQSFIDSMGLVNLITIIEEIIEKKCGKFIPIADERAMSLTSSPFKNVTTLKNYIDLLINE